jgi:hypothetical protein
MYLFPDFWVLRDVRSEFTDDVSQFLVGPIFTGQINNSSSFDHWSNEQFLFI